MPGTTAFHHYALTVDRTAALAVIYIDGVPDPPVDISILLGSISPDQDLKIGGLNDSEFMGLDGRLDDLRFYNHKLEASEVEALAGVTPCPADVNGDNVVDVLDLLAVLAAWGATSGPEDINGDGIVDVLDLLDLLAAWGPC
jgi:hypothetical protein